MDMDVSKLKVAELKEQLISRGLDSKGLKAALVQRLQEAIDADGSGGQTVRATHLESSESTPDENPEEATVDSSAVEENNISIEKDVSDSAENSHIDAADSVGASEETTRDEGEHNTISSEVVSEDHSEFSNSTTNNATVSSDVPENVTIKNEVDSNSETNQPSEECSGVKDDSECKQGETEVSDIKIENDSIKKEDVEEEKVSGTKRSHSPDKRDVKRANVVKDITDEPEFDNTKVLLDWYNSDLSLIIDPKTMLSAKPLSKDGFGYIWSGVRATYGFNMGKYCFEVKITDHNNVDHLTDEPDPHVLRVGWSVNSATMQLGEDPASFGYGGTAKFAHNLKFKDYGCKFSYGDVVGAYMDASAEQVTLHYTVNGVYQGVACSMNRDQLGSVDTALFPHILTKNSAFEVNMGQLESAWFSHPAELSDYTFCADATDEFRTRGSVGPETKGECTIIMMVGLPSCGKTTWVNKFISENSERKFNVLGTNLLIDRMRVMGLPRKKNYHGRWDQLIASCMRCLNTLLEMAHRRRRNYIIDQTNVYQSAQRRKLRNFSSFVRKAVVVVPSEEDFSSRVAQVVSVEGKVIPDSSVNEMKVAFKLPVTGDYLDEVEFAELQQEEAQKLVDKYAKEARDAGFLPPWEKNNSNQRRGSRPRGSHGKQNSSWRDRQQQNRHSPGGWRSDQDRRSGGGGWRGASSSHSYNGRSMQPQPWASGSYPQQRWGSGNHYNNYNNNYGGGGGYSRNQMTGGYNQWSQYNQYRSNSFQQYGGGYQQSGYRGGYGRR